MSHRQTHYSFSGSNDRDFNNVPLAGGGSYYNDYQLRQQQLEQEEQYQRQAAASSQGTGFWSDAFNMQARFYNFESFQQAFDASIGFIVRNKKRIGVGLCVLLYLLFMYVFVSQCYSFFWASGSPEDGVLTGVLPQQQSRIPGAVLANHLTDKEQMFRATPLFDFDFEEQQAFHLKQFSSWQGLRNDPAFRQPCYVLYENEIANRLINLHDVTAEDIRRNANLTGSVHVVAQVADMVAANEHYLRQWKASMRDNPLVGEQHVGVVVPQSWDLAGNEGAGLEAMHPEARNHTEQMWVCLMTLEGRNGVPVSMINPVLTNEYEIAADSRQMLAVPVVLGDADLFSTNGQEIRLMAYKRSHVSYYDPTNGALRQTVFEGEESFMFQMWLNFTTKPIDDLLRQIIPPDMPAVQPQVPQKRVDEEGYIVMESVVRVSSSTGNNNAAPQE